MDIRKILNGLKLGALEDRHGASTHLSNLTETRLNSLIESFSARTKTEKGDLAGAYGEAAVILRRELIRRGLPSDKQKKCGCGRTGIYKIGRQVICRKCKERRFG